MTERFSEYPRGEYQFEVIHAKEGGYVVRYPDLPGCFAQVEAGDEPGSIASEILERWLAVAIVDGEPIPLPASVLDPQP